MREITFGHYHGNAVSRKTYSGFNLMELRFRPGDRMPAHFHESAMLSSVLKGESTQKRGREETLRLPGIHRFHSAGEVHSDRIHQDGLSILIVQMQTDWLRELKEQGVMLPRSFDVRHDTLDELCNRLLLEIRQRDRLTDLALSSLMLEIAVQLSRKSVEITVRNQPKWLAQAIEFIHESRYSGCSLTEIAAAAHVHPVHLARMFRKTYHQSVGEYVQNLRIEDAKIRLQLSEESVAEISETLGFFDQSHFTKVFKAATSITPDAFRNAHRL